MKVTKSRGFKKETLLTVTFERESPEADTPTFECVFEVRYPEGFGKTTAVLIPLSVTQQDTRATVTLTEEETRQVHSAAADFLADE